MPKTDTIIDVPDREQAAYRWWMHGLLLAGIVLRLAVFLTCSPFNPDEHYEVIQYIAQNHGLPYSNQFTPQGTLTQSFHPPLYHALMALLYMRWPVPMPIHFVSFVLSSLNLLLIRWLLNRPLVFSQASSRLMAMSFAAFLPEFVMFGGFISNDTLALPLGTLLFTTVLLYLQQPRGSRLALMGTITGFCLLTKGTFILVGPALAILVLVVETHNGLSRSIRRVIFFCLIWSVLGCYKYLENYLYYGRPIVHNLDPGGLGADMQRGTLKGLQTIYDINILKLIRHPVIDMHNIGSYPLLLYGTFWYPHIPESSYTGNICGYQWVGSILYGVAVVPTLIFLIGFLRASVISGKTIAMASLQRQWEPRAMIVLSAMLLFMANFVVVIAAGVKYDVWSCFQSRLCFQSMMPILIFLGLGLEMLPGPRLFRRIVYAICWATVAACVLYFGIEIALAKGLLSRGPEIRPW